MSTVTNPSGTEVNLERPGLVRWGVRGFYVTMFLVTALVIWFATFKPIIVLPRISLAPGFLLTDQTGSSLTSEDVRGQITLYSFTYGGCAADDCPQTAADIALVHEQMNQIAPTDIPVRLITISLDPDHDTPDQLATLLAEQGDTAEAAVPWDFVTGDPLRTKQVVGSGFGLFYEPRVNDSGEAFVRFEPRYFLVDGLGTVRARYRAARPEQEILQRDINLLVEEARNSDGVARYGYEAAHLFVCYP